MVRRLIKDEEWAFFASFLVPAGAGSGRPPSSQRLILDGVFWIVRAGVPWRDLHADFGKSDSVLRVQALDLAVVWDVILEALNDSAGGQDRVQMIDCTIVRAQKHAAGAKKGELLHRQRAACEGLGRGSTQAPRAGIRKSAKRSREGSKAPPTFSMMDWREDNNCRHAVREDDGA